MESRIVGQKVFHYLDESRSKEDRIRIEKENWNEDNGDFKLKKCLWVGRSNMVKFKQGRIHSKTVTDGSAGAVMQKTSWNSKIFVTEWCMGGPVDLIDWQLMLIVISFSLKSNNVDPGREKGRGRWQQCRCCHEWGVLLLLLFMLLFVLFQKEIRERAKFGDQIWRIIER